MSMFEKGPLRVEPTINAGHILQFFGVLIGGVSVAWAIMTHVVDQSESIARNATRIEAHDQKFVEMGGRMDRMREDQNILANEIRAELRSLGRKLDEMGRRPH